MQCRHTATGRDRSHCRLDRQCRWEGRCCVPNCRCQSYRTRWYCTAEVRNSDQRQYCQAALSQGRAETRANGLILVWPVIFAQEVPYLRGEKGPLTAINSGGKHSREGNPGARRPAARRIRFVEQLQPVFACGTRNQSLSFCARSQKPSEQFRKWLRTWRWKNTSVSV